MEVIPRQWANVLKYLLIILRQFTTNFAKLAFIMNLEKNLEWSQTFDPWVK